MRASDATIYIKVDSFNFCFEIMENIYDYKIYQDIYHIRVSLAEPRRYKSTFMKNIENVSVN